MAAHTAFYLISTGALSRGLNGQDVKLTTHHHLAPRLRMSAVILILPPACLNPYPANVENMVSS